MTGEDARVEMDIAEGRAELEGEDARAEMKSTRPEHIVSHILHNWILSLCTNTICRCLSSKEPLYIALY
jgi:hypothetical protein